MQFFIAYVVIKVKCAVPHEESRQGAHVPSLAHIWN